MKKYRSHFGFSLIELSIVLVVVGLLISSMISGFVTYTQNRRIQEARQDLQNIHDALIGFAMQNRRLPCPDDDGPGVATDGQEDPPGGGGGCTQTAGYLPFRDLGLAGARRDPWGNPYLYAVDPLMADADDTTYNFNAPGCPSASDNTTSFAVCAVGSLEIKDTGLQGPPGVCPFPCRDIADNVAAVFLSSGENWLNNTSIDEQENVPTWFAPIPPPATWNGDDRIYVSRQFERAGANRFDDIVMWLPSSILINRMVQAGHLP